MEHERFQVWIERPAEARRPRRGALRLVAGGPTPKERHQ